MLHRATPTIARQVPIAHIVFIAHKVFIAHIMFIAHIVRRSRRMGPGLTGRQLLPP
jgi:hypothetical protein